MLVATLIAALGFLSVATITQLFGYRLGGTITIPVLAVYTLKSFLMLPVFVLSTLAAYVGLWVLKRRTLIYGRDELVSAVLIGTVVPVVAVLFVFRTGIEERAIVFIGSILPGLAAYNYHQLKPEYRRRDLLATVGLLVVLLAIGWLLITPRGARTIGTLTPPALFAQTADIALYKRATVPGLEPIIIPRAVAALLFAGGLVVAEMLRGQYAVRVGVIAAVLMAIYALTNYWLLALYVVVYLLAYAFIELVNYTTLRYGRVALGIGAAFAVVATVPLSLALPIVRGLSAFFVGILASVTAYNAHATAPIERRLVLPLQVLVFVPTLFVARLFSTPTSRSVLPEITVWALVVGLIAVLLALGAAHLYTVRQPDESRVLSASILSEGGGS